MSRILQVSDLHLMADPEKTLKGVATRQTWQRVVDRIRRYRPGFERLVLTGDLTHDERRESYDHLKETLHDWLPRCLFIPGNHDDRELLRATFSGTAGNGCPPYVTFSTVVDRWHCLGLDTHVPGELYGEMPKQQLQWAVETIRRHEQPTILFMHHPPFSVGTPWLDRIGLRDGETFLRTMHELGSVRLICTGHVHQQLRYRRGGMSLLTTPSTGVQFQQGTDELVVDTRPPGFRVIDLTGQNLRSRVIRVD